jgi:hypothetical protein
MTKTLDINAQGNNIEFLVTITSIHTVDVHTAIAKCVYILYLLNIVNTFHQIFLNCTC